MKKGWITKPLGEVGTFQRGSGFLKSDFVDNGYPCIHYGQIHTVFGVSTEHHIKCIPESLALSKSKIAKPGDVIIAITSEDVEGSCKCTAWLGDYDVAVGSHAAIFHHSLNPKFVAYYLRGGAFSREKEKYAHGFKVVEIKPADIAKINISYPGEKEQERIVGELDLLSSIIDLKKQQIRELDTLSLSLFYEMFGDPVKNECGWETRALKDVCERLYAGGDVPKDRFSKDKNSTFSVPIFSNGKGDSALYGYTDVPREYSPAITISGRGTIGYSCIRPEPFFPIIRLIVAVPSSQVNIVFLQKQLSIMPFESRGGAIPQLTIPMIKDRKVIIPPQEKQVSYAERITEIENEKKSILDSVNELEALFNSRMYFWFN